MAGNHAAEADAVIMSAALIEYSLPTLIVRARGQAFVAGRSALPPALSPAELSERSSQELNKMADDKGLITFEGPVQKLSFSGIARTPLQFFYLLSFFYFLYG